MNRELKFRYWNPLAKTYKMSWRYSLTHDGKILAYDVDMMNYDEPTDPKNSALVIQQYTGCKDKNGTPIYEGDILVTDHDGGEGEANIGVVYFAAGTYMIDGDGPFYDHVYGHSPDILDNHTVIGNKFENSELLKA
jgi:uncharacterized phage protein (TIGR01671 family)